MRLVKANLRRRELCGQLLIIRTKENQREKPKKEGKTNFNTVTKRNVKVTTGKDEENYHPSPHTSSSFALASASALRRALSFSALAARFCAFSAFSACFI
jgi:hypothetical protein